jgi:hypothetical protein
MSIFPVFSIIINNFNGVEKLEKCISSIQKSNYPRFEIIVSDCLTPGIEDWMKKHFPDVKLVCFKKDIGPAASRNGGLSISDPGSKYVIFVDNDTNVHPSWLRGLESVFENTHDIGAAQPLLLKMNDHEIIDGLGGFFDYMGYACLPPFFTKSLAQAPKEPKDICYCEAVTVVKRSVLYAFPDPNNPYDPDYFQHWEDVDMCWKVMLLGYRIVLVPDSVVFHERGVSAGLGKQSSELVYLNTRNRLTSLIKNYESWSLLKYVPILILFELIKTTLLLTKNSEHAVSTFRGLLWNLTNLRPSWEKRVKVQYNTRTVKDAWIKKHLMKPSLIRLIQDFQRHYRAHK